MRLKVNGVEIRVVDQIEIVLEVAPDGEDLIHGIDVKFRGGPLTVRSIPKQGTAFLFHTQRTMFLRGRETCFFATNEDPSPPRLLPLGTALPWDTDGHGFEARCEDGEAPAIHMEADPPSIVVTYNGGHGIAARLNKSPREIEQE